MDNFIWKWEKLDSLFHYCQFPDSTKMFHKPAVLTTFHSEVANLAIEGVGAKVHWAGGAGGHSEK